MDQLNSLYARLLHFGLLAARDAIDLQNHEWARAEVELLHNIPSLLNEQNWRRHRYFWFSERQHYIEWVNQSGADEPQKRMRLFYEPVWREMEPLLLEWFEE